MVGDRWRLVSTKELQERLISVNPEHFDSEPARRVSRAWRRQQPISSDQHGAWRIKHCDRRATWHWEEPDDCKSVAPTSQQAGVVRCREAGGYRGGGEAVDQVGLASLVLDAHGGRLKPKDLYEQFSTCLDLAAKFPPSQDQARMALMSSTLRAMN